MRAHTIWWMTNHILMTNLRSSSVKQVVLWSSRQLVEITRRFQIRSFQMLMASWLQVSTWPIMISSSSSTLWWPIRVFWRQVATHTPMNESETWCPQIWLKRAASITTTKSSISYSLEEMVGDKGERTTCSLRTRTRPLKPRQWPKAALILFSHFPNSNNNSTNSRRWRRRAIRTPNPSPSPSAAVRHPWANNYFSSIESARCWNR